MRYTKTLQQKYHFIDAYLNDYQEVEGSFERYKIAKPESSFKEQSSTSDRIVVKTEPAEEEIKKLTASGNSRKKSSRSTASKYWP